MRYLFTKYAYFTWPGLFILNFVKKKIRFTTEIIYILLFLYQMVDIKHWEDIFMEKFTSKCIYDINLFCSLWIDNVSIKIDYVFFKHHIYVSLIYIFMPKCYKSFIRLDFTNTTLIKLLSMYHNIITKIKPMRVMCFYCNARYLHTSMNHQRLTEALWAVNLNFLVELQFCS